MLCTLFKVKCLYIESFKYHLISLVTMERQKDGPLERLIYGEDNPTSRNGKDKSELTYEYKKFFYPIQNDKLLKSFEKTLKKDIHLGVEYFKENHPELGENLEMKVLLKYKSVKEALSFINDKMGEGIITFYETLPTKSNLLESIEIPDVYLGVLNVTLGEIDEGSINGGIWKKIHNEINKTLGYLPKKYALKLFNPYDGTYPVRKDVLEIGYALIEKEE